MSKPMGENRMSNHAAPKAPTLSKVKAGGITAGIGTLVTGIVADLVNTGHLSLDSKHALVALVAALIVWGGTHLVAYGIEELHLQDYAESVWGGAEQGAEWSEDLRDVDLDDDLGDDGDLDEEDFEDDGEFDDDLAEPLDEPADDDLDEDEDAA